MKWFQKLMVPCLILAAVACGDSGPGPKGDADKTPAQVKTEIEGQDATMLEEAVAKYESAIAGLKTDGGKLEVEIKELGSQVLGELLGDEKAAETKADVKKQVAELEGELKALEAQVKDLVAKLKVYTEELASRI
jgi:chromosome segregation ATPase